MNRSIAIAAFIAVMGVAGTSHATYRFCPNWAYTFNDQNLGEDYLKHNVGATRGEIPAARTFAALQKDGATVWQGLLDSQGCTPVQPSTQAAKWKLFVTGASIGREDLPAFFRVYDNDSRQLRWFTWEQSLGATSAAQRHVMTLGNGDHIASVAAIVVHLMSLPDVVVRPIDTPIFANDDCSGGVGSCGDASGIYIGLDHLGRKDAFTKYVVLHEIGHALQDVLTGLFVGDYEAVSSSNALCRCDHVQPEGFRLHCLQSLEEATAALEEGFAHFVAADVLNRPDQSDAIFAYYKQVNVPPSFILQPPVALSINGAYRWNATQCGGDWNTTGTELDWMAFFYELNNKGGNGPSFTYSDLRSLFINFCNGPCDRNDVATTFGLALTVSSVWSANPAKVTFFNQTATKHFLP